jgi:HAD superfamily hydrolase (TIGR01509 family)
MLGVMERKYSVIVFDLGNVLIPFDYNIAYNRLEKIETGLGQRFLDQYKENYHLHRSFERGELPEKEFLSKLLGFIGNKVDADFLIDVYSKIFREDKDVSSLLPVLKKRYTLVLLSNTNSIHQRYWHKEYEFIKYFDKLILSHEVKAYKPEEKIYKAVEAFTKKSPEEHLFIDDVADYAEGARRAGWDAIHFIGYGNLVAGLKERGIL